MVGIVGVLLFKLFWLGCMLMYVIGKGKCVKILVFIFFVGSNGIVLLGVNLFKVFLW